jgi:hypothetical protein
LTATPALNAAAGAERYLSACVRSAWTLATRSAARWDTAKRPKISGLPVTLVPCGEIHHQIPAGKGSFTLVPRMLTIIHAAVSLCLAPHALRPQQPPTHRAIRMCAPSGAPEDKQMSRPDDLVTLAETTTDFRALMEAALVRLDKRRRLEGQPKYETIDGMVDSYVEEAAKAGLGWTRAEAESEVVRFLKRKALANEGSPGQNPDDVFIGIFAIIVIYSAVTGFAPAQELPAAVVSPY